MLRYLSLRVLYTLPVIWLVVSLVFLLIHLVPGDPILQMLGEGAPATDVQAARHAYGLDLPLGRQYLNYWKGVLHGDLGPSLRFNQSVTRLIAQRYPYTLQLTLAALVVADPALGSGRRALGATAQSLGRPPAQRRQPVRFVVPQLRSGSDPDSVFRHQAGMAAGLRFGQVRAPGASRNHHGRRAGRDPDPHGAHLHAGRVGPGLHSHRARQGTVGAHGGLSSRPAQCHDSRDHGAGPAVRRAAGRRHRDRNDFFLARNRTADHPGHLQSRLLPGAGMHSGDWT